MPTTKPNFKTFIIMHSRIFQVSLQSISKDEWSDADTIAQYSHPMCSIDYARTIEDDDEREEDISYLVEALGDMFTLNPDGQSMTYNGGMDEWKKKYIARIREEVSALNVDNVFHSLNLYRIQDAIKHPLGYCLFAFDGNCFAVDSDEFMECVDRLNVGDTVYFGAVMDYHF